MRDPDMDALPLQQGARALGFLADLSRVRGEVLVTLGSGPRPAPVSLGEGLGLALARFVEAGKRGNKLLFVGNGGSAAIASHQAVDYSKNGGIPAIAFNDASLLTCMANDLGYENVFAWPISRFAAKGDVLVAISSSGRSPNILGAVKAAREAGCEVVTFSGFEAQNALRSSGEVNFYVPSRSYGIVEVVHLSLIHSILEEKMLSGESA